MYFKIAGLLNGLAMLAFLGIWIILLLVAKPDCLQTVEAAKQAIIYAFSQPYTDFFHFSIVSILVCLICGILLFAKKFPVYAMYAIFVHAVLALFIYDWSLSLAIALPLILFKRVRVSP